MPIDPNHLESSLGLAVPGDAGTDRGAIGGVEIAVTDVLGNAGLGQTEIRPMSEREQKIGLAGLEPAT